MQKFIKTFIPILLIVSLLTACGTKETDNDKNEAASENITESAVRQENEEHTGTGNSVSDKKQTDSSADNSSHIYDTPEIPAAKPAGNPELQPQKSPANPPVPERPSKPLPDKQPVPDDGKKPSMMDRINAIYRNAHTGPQTVTSVQQLAILTSKNYSVEGAGPISVTPALLNGEEVTLVMLGGTQFTDGQATTIKESELASKGQMNDYLAALIKLIENGTIPSHKPMFITGISLGGMIAQQILGEQELLDSHGITVRGVVTFGSPLTRPFDRHGVKVVRFADVHDIVPVLGELPVYNDSKSYGGFCKLIKIIRDSNNAERIYIKSKYTNPIETHALSYIEDECWNDFDFFGSRDKENVLVLLEKMKFYAAPKLS